VTTADNKATNEQLEGHVFVSYARNNQKFVDLLVAALERKGERTWLDREQIPDAMKWMEQIHFAIVDARACIFIISEQAVESEVWNTELNEALNHGKRLVPVIIDNVKADRVPAVLRELQWIDFRSQGNLDESVQSLIETIAKNPEWVLAHTRFSIKAAEWRRAEGKKGPLLRGVQLKEATSWIENPDTQIKDPSLTNDQVAFIQASLVARKRRLIGTIGSIAFALVLIIVAVQQYQQAEYRKQVAAAQSIADTADQAFGETGQALQVSTLLAVQSLAIADTGEGRRTMLRNLALLPNVSFLLDSFDEAILSMTFSPDGKQLLVGTETKGAKLCYIETRECKQSLPVPGYVRHVEFSKDGHYLFTAGANAIIWDIKNLDQPLISVGNNDAQAYAVSPDFKYVAISDQYGYGEIRHIENGERSLINFDAGVFSLAFNQHGTLLASGSLLGTIQIWKVPSGEPFKCNGKQEQLQWSHGQRINTLAFVQAPFSTSFAAGSGFRTGGRPDNSTRIWRLCDPHPAKTIQHENQVRSIVFSDNSKLFTSMSFKEVVLSTYEPNLRGSTTQWNVGRISFKADATVTKTAFVPGKYSVAIGWAHSRGGTIIIFKPLQQANPSEPNIKEIQRVALDSAPQSFAFSQDSNYLATGEKNGKVRIWPLNLENNNVDTHSATELILEACRKLPAQVRHSIINSQNWQLPSGYLFDNQSYNDPCSLIESNR